MTTARFFGGGLLVLLAAVCLVVLAKAQPIPDEVRLVPPEARLVSPEEGEAIVQTPRHSGIRDKVFVAGALPSHPRNKRETSQAAHLTISASIQSRAGTYNLYANRNGSLHKHAVPPGVQTYAKQADLTVPLVPPVSIERKKIEKSLISR